MKLGPLTRREQILSVSAAGVLFCAALYLWAVEPMVEQWAQLDGQIYPEEMRLGRQRQILARAEAIQTSYEAFVASRASAATDDEIVGGLLKRVDQTSGVVAGNMQIQGLKPQPVVDQGAYRIYSVECETEGNLVDLGRFVYELEHGAAGLRVSRLWLSAAGEEGALKGRMVITRIAAGEAPP